NAQNSVQQTANQQISSVQQALASGAALAGKIISSTPTQPAQGQFQLTVQTGQSQINLTSNTPLPTGQNVTLSQDNKGNIIIQATSTNSQPASLVTSGSLPKSSLILTISAQITSNDAPKLNTPNTPAQVVASSSSNAATNHKQVPSNFPQSSGSTAASSRHISANTENAQTAIYARPTTPNNATNGSAGSKTGTSSAQPSLAMSSPRSGFSISPPPSSNSTGNVSNPNAVGNTTAAQNAQSPVSPQSTGQSSTSTTAQSTTNLTTNSSSASSTTAAQQNTGQPITAQITQPKTQAPPASPLGSETLQTATSKPTEAQRSALPSQAQSSLGQTTTSAVTQTDTRITNNSVLSGHVGNSASQSVLSSNQVISKSSASAQITPPLPSSPTTNTQPTLGSPEKTTTALHSATLVTSSSSKPFNVSTPIPLATGTQVWVTQSDKYPQQVSLTFSQALAEPSKNNPLNPQERSLIADQARSSFPLQQPAGQVLTQLSNLSPLLQANPQVQGAINSVLQLFGVMPGATNAPEIVRNNVVSCGQQTPANIGRTGNLSTGDMTSALSKLQSVATQLPDAQRTQLENLIQQTLARITHQQTQALQAQADIPEGSPETRVLHTDIPVWQGKVLDNVDVWISREGGSTNNTVAEDTQQQWRVFLHFSLENAGDLDVELRITNEDSADIKFWAKNSALLSQLNDERALFSQRLKGLGLNEVTLSQFHGSGPRPAQQLSKHSLVDTHS
ncbi:MAG: flagellar hook-length control protein FliK, partial [Pontibacterium sp.]